MSTLVLIILQHHTYYAAIGVHESSWRHSLRVTLTEGEFKDDTHHYHASHILPPRLHAYQLMTNIKGMLITFFGVESRSEGASSPSASTSRTEFRRIIKGRTIVAKGGE
eukprot:4262133-Pyramimonas_sp.AAC.2